MSVTLAAVQHRTIQHRAGLDRFSDRRLLRELAYVDGRWVAGAHAASFLVIDPATGHHLAQVASLDLELGGHAPLIVFDDADFDCVSAWKIDPVVRGIGV
ncbi:hypothetical protein ACO2RV_24530 [Ancylobacter sp. VNQ12]|uniref:hypothetical protein n=1 Tax=Ancylobacter sp. VNQ12 TaxID=3400920 RepID=UPI003C022D5F